jgi:hypothetical protein
MLTVDFTTNESCVADAPPRRKLILPYPQFQGNIKLGMSRLYYRSSVLRRRQSNAFWPLLPPCSTLTMRVLTFLRILFVFLSYNFSRGFLQVAWKAASLMNSAVSFSRITFPCCVWPFVFGKRRRMTVFSRITFRFRLANTRSGVKVVVTNRKVIQPDPSRTSRAEGREKDLAFVS